jgi:hypothetical protein
MKLKNKYNQRIVEGNAQICVLACVFTNYQYVCLKFFIFNLITKFFTADTYSATRFYTTRMSLQVDAALVYSALVYAALRKSGLISNGCSGREIDLVCAIINNYANIFLSSNEFRLLTAWYINLNCFSNHQLQWK